jgi:glycopeptide antibiotics resistance protein
MKVICILILFFCILCVFYFSWLPNPSFVNQSYLPRWLVYWADVYVQLRTAIPFLPIGFLCQYLFKPASFFTFNGFVLALIVVALAEIGQFFLPYRFPDWMDVFYGLAGALVGMLAYYILNYMFRPKKAGHEK